MNEDRHGILPAPGFTGNAICGCDPMWLGKATESGEDSIEQGSGNEKRPADAGLSFDWGEGNGYCIPLRICRLGAMSMCENQKSY